MYFEDVFRTFEKAKLKYIIAGGIAVNLHGVPRMTYDLDILIDLVPGNIRRLFSTLSELSFRPRVPIKEAEFANSGKRRGFIEEKGIKVLSFWQDGSPVREVDVFIDNPIEFGDLWEGRAEADLGGGLKVPVVGIDHLIEIKRRANRKQDLADIEQLTVVKKLMA